MRATRIASRAVPALAGAVLLALTVPVVAGVPIWGTGLLLAGIAYLALLWWLPWLWLWVLPLVTVALDLTPWTGWFLFSELDWFFLLTLCGSAMFGRYAKIRESAVWMTPDRWLLLAYLLLLFVAGPALPSLWQAPAVPAEDPYLTAGYGYKVLRGVAWGVLLAPLWLSLASAGHETARRHLLGGLCTAGLVLLLIVLWERGVLLQLSQAKPGLAGTALLDFSSSYRVTGLFSDMHTGGEVIDAVIVLLLAAALHAVITVRSPLMRTAGIAATAGLLYVTLVGFTRSTYASVALLLAAYPAWLLLAQRQRLGLSLASVMLASAAVPCALLAAYRLLGFLDAPGGLDAPSVLGAPGLWVFLVLPVLALLAGPVRSWPAGPWVLALLVLLVMPALLQVAGVIDDVGTAGTLAAIAAAVAALLSMQRLFVAAAGAPFVDRALVLLALLLVPASMATALVASQMDARMASVDRDYGTRLQHWRDVVSASDAPLGNIAGNGVGRFPLHYAEAWPLRRAKLATFTVVAAEDRHVLRLQGGRDLTVGQRIAVDSDALVLGLTLRGEPGSRLLVSLCQRNILDTGRRDRACSFAAVRPSTGEGNSRRVLRLPVPEGRLDAAGRPLLLGLRNMGAGSELDVWGLQALSGSGASVRNGNFAQGMQHWFFYTDLAHLPYHVKNLWLQAWFDTGWLGLLLLTGLVGVGLWRAHGAASRRPEEQFFMLGVLVVGILGLFGSPLDSARVSWLFYFFLAAVLLAPPAAGKDIQTAGDRE
ncbi:hypothetical protein [Chromatocurvus halotolerans]|uniref:Uncharacterized protein n=1 Tax=Chromatocurvus halotolerans TaxID=1132028 RepID=A0A4R2KTD4_9GAMM|nr:hypothetical protein [Chromatocurvus halotolerans]TCO74346.1 hypothetical protein EV688_11459 [Chromatocurvus halotolerans]